MLINPIIMYVKQQQQNEENQRKKKWGPSQRTLTLKHSIITNTLWAAKYDTKSMCKKTWQQTKCKHKQHKKNIVSLFFFHDFLIYKFHSSLSASTSAEGLTKMSHSAVSRHRGSLGATPLDPVKGHRSPRGKLRVRGRAGSGLGWMWRGQCGQVRSGRGLVVCWG